LAFHQHQISELHQEVIKEVAKTISSQAISIQTISPEEISSEKIPA
jgi:hypothetical protein